MAHPSIQNWLDATMKIECNGQTGTGFLVARPLAGNEAGCKVFLITNKHVLHPDPALRCQVKQIILHLNMQSNLGPVGGNTIQINNTIWKEHPEANIDVVAIDVTLVINQFPNVRRKWATYIDMALPPQLDQLNITAGDEILTMGYPEIHPYLMNQGGTYYAIVRKGIIATQIGNPLTEINMNQKRNIRGFLIDGGVIPGSSGSPVILNPVSSRMVKGTIHMQPAPALLLGIISETRYGINKGTQKPEFAGMGMAIDVAAVKETIELFF